VRHSSRGETKIVNVDEAEEGWVAEGEGEAREMTNIVYLEMKLLEGIII